MSCYPLVVAEPRQHQIQKEPPMHHQVVGPTLPPHRRHGTSGNPGGLTLLACFLLIALTSSAAAPSNDVCAGAQTIPPTGPFPLATPIVDITDATISASDPALPPIYANAVSRSTWYVFRPSATALYTISSCADSSTVVDPVLAIYSSPAGCTGPFTRLDFADEISACESFTLQLLSDSIYYIVVWKYDEGTPDDGKNQLQLTIDRLILPPNDTCAAAISAQLNVPIHGSTAGATNNYQIVGTSAFWGLDQTPSTAAGRDVVYSFTAPEAGTYSFKVFNYDVLQNLVLYVAPGPACPTGTFPIGIANCLAAANRSGVNSAEEIVCLPMAANQKVIAIVDDQPAAGQSANRGSPFDFEVTLCSREQETNNSPATAVRLTPGVEGSISPVGDVDFFALGSFPPGWRAFALVDGEAARNADFDLRITTTVDTLEYDNDNNDSVFGASSPNIAGTLLTGAPAFVEVSYLGGDDSEPYRLYAAVQPPWFRAVQESEPNGNLEQANSAEANYFYGVLEGPSPSQDADLFSFGVAEGDLIFLSLDGDPHRTNSPINARLELLDSSGGTLVLVNDTASSSFGGTNVATNTLTGFGPSAPAEGIIYRANVEGTFYARVSISPSAAGSSGSGAYLLSVTKNGITGSSGFNNAPALTNIAVTSPVSATFTATLTGFIWEPDIGDGAHLIVSWGDGATNLVDYPAPGRIYISLPHVYTTGPTNHTINLHVADRHGATDIASTTVQVRPRPLAATLLDIDKLPGGNIRLQLQGTPNAFYVIEKADVLSSWSSLGTNIAGPNGLFSFDDTAPHPNSRFYRAVGQ
jgi:hypothetical protein